MRRLIASIAALFTLASLSATAMASLDPLRSSHACCIRSHEKHECHDADDETPAAAEEQQEESNLHLHANHDCCNVCVWPALISKSAARQREVLVVMPVPEHRFAQEFYPVDVPQPSTQATPERAPPAKKPRHLAAIYSLIAFVRHHI
jgi:hypothetical protein